MEVHHKYIFLSVRELKVTLRLALTLILYLFLFL